MKLGFIGLGIMGTPMALRLAKAGHALHVTTIGPVADELLKHGAQHLACAEQVAEQSDIIFIMVPRRLPRCCLANMVVLKRF